MRLGLTSPVVLQVPGIASEWEAGAGIAELTQVARAADALGFDFLTCAEHVAVPAAAGEGRGNTYWDPLATLGYLAACTSRIRLATSVVVLGYHHPLALAKRYGTLDRLSGGRLVLGVGVGSLAEEFALLGAAWQDRGDRADDALRALRASLSQREPAYAGAFYHYGGFVVEPHAVQQRVPLWVGGRSGRSLRRAVTLADGWMPFGLSADQLRGLLTRVRVPEGFEVVLPAGRVLDPIGEPDDTTRRLRATVRAGATIVNCAVRAESASHYCEQLATLRALADTAGGKEAE
ncbi:LLM class F420-dependent oxidoreductase [Mycobacterium sp.]|uniref:LLM class F420-dependent oxidoreductase n=1 Tax=Mycobacterium sp. TaxID=1785 RepID=UPI003D6AB0C9